MPRHGFKSFINEINVVNHKSLGNKKKVSHAEHEQIWEAPTCNHHKLQFCYAHTHTYIQGQNRFSVNLILRVLSIDE